MRSCRTPPHRGVERSRSRLTSCPRKIWRSSRTRFDRSSSSIVSNVTQPPLMRSAASCGSTRQRVFKPAGESGPLFSPNTAEKSVLLQALRYEEMQMPPDAPLSEAIINDFAKWVRRGAPFPQPAVPAKPVVRKKPIESSHWAFHSPQKPTVPTVTNNDWPRQGYRSVCIITNGEVRPIPWGRC